MRTREPSSLFGGEFPSTENVGTGGCVVEGGLGKLSCAGGSRSWERGNAGGEGLAFV